MEVAGDAAAFALDGAGAQMPEEEDVFERGADVAGDALEPGEVGALEGLAGVDEEEAAGGLATLVKGHRHHGAHIELLLGGAGEAREGVEAAPIAAVPAEAAAGAFEVVPADGGVHVVEKETVGAGEGVAFGDEALAFASFEAPEVDALEIGVAIGEQGGFDLEGAGEFVQHEAERFGEALVDLESCGDAGEEVVLRGEMAAAVGQEGEGGAASECAADKAHPGDDAHPADFAFNGGEQDEDEGESAG